MRDLEPTLWSTVMSLRVDVGLLWDLGAAGGKPESWFHPGWRHCLWANTAVPPWRGDRGAEHVLELPRGWCRGKGGGPPPMRGLVLEGLRPRGSAWWPQECTAQMSLKQTQLAHHS